MQHLSKPKQIRRPFADLIRDRKIDKTEAAMLKAGMRKQLDRYEMITREEFDRQRARILRSPAGG